MTAKILTWNRAFMLVPVALLASCAVTPPGPHVAVMPAPGKPFEQFAAEEQYCRGYAEQSTGMSASDASAKSMAGSAAVGTVIGAAAGAALGGHHNGAATGAEMGLITGTVVGANQGALAAKDIQRRYDIAYEQCMYAKGNQLPGATTNYRQPPVVAMPPQSLPPSYPPSSYPPPPPPR